MKYDPHTEKIDYRLLFNSWGRSTKIDPRELNEIQREEEKEKIPTYKIVDLEFNDTTRVARVSFCESRKYKTILKYVTKNYVKYPMYSDWKTKEKIIKKTVRLNNQGLENLLFNEDFLIKTFAFEIIDLINNENFIPSWYRARPQFEKMEKEIQKIMSSYEKSKNEIECEIYNLQVEMQPFLIRKNKIEASFAKDNEKLERLLVKLRDNERKAAIIKTKFERRRESFLRKNATFFDKVEYYEREIQKCENKILRKYDESKKKIAAEEKMFMDCVQKNRKLPTDLETVNDSFIPLKNISGVTYKKIVGVYVIHNKEFDKYYVGQSKDIMRRLGQHFKGTKVNNVIFAEDYYRSTFANKSEIFEVKIISLRTKDELDAKEKELIELYDSFKNGYNGTNGNC